MKAERHSVIRTRMVGTRDGRVSGVSTNFPVAVLAVLVLVAVFARVLVALFVSGCVLVRVVVLVQEV